MTKTWLHPGYFSSGLQVIDPLIANTIADETERQEGVAELIASENIVSRAVLEAQGSILTNKTVVGYAGARFHTGGLHVDRIEREAIARATTLFGCGFANVQPHSGIHANMAVFMALVEPGQTVLAMSPAAGGHISHGAAANLTGRMARVVFYGVGADERIDYGALERQAQAERPRLLVAGGAAYPHVIDFPRLRAIADAVGAWLLVDMAHFAGLVAGGAHPSPLPHAHVVTTTTYKSLRGPRGGMILCNDPDLAARLDKAVFPGIQGTPLLHVVAGKAVCLAEAMRPEFSAYAAAVLANARALAVTLAEQGLRPVGGGTDTPIVLVDLRRLGGVTGHAAAECLERAGITCNRMAIPLDETDPVGCSGLRFGVSACTTRGLDAAPFGQLGAWIGALLRGLHDDPAGSAARESATREAVRALMASYPLS